MPPLEAHDGNPAAPADRNRAAGPTRARIAALIVSVLFLGFGAQQVFAQQGLIYSPCWSKDECLNLNATPGSTSQNLRGMGECANGRCFCADASCYDPHRHEAACPAGQGKCYANPPPVPLTITIGGAATTLDVGDYIAKVYNYGVSIAGILAGVMFVVGGFQYLTAGNSGRVSKAKERIRDALIGLFLVLGAYVILNTINPDVLTLQLPKISLVKKKLFVACQYFAMQMPCGQSFTLVKIPGTDNLPVDQQYRVAQGGAADQGATTTTQCIGSSCSRAGGDDATQRCKIPPNTPTSASVNAPGPSTNTCAAAPVAPYQCLPCLTDGADCTGSGPSQDCCGGYCVSGRVRAAAGGFGSAVGQSGYSGTGSSLFQGTCSNGANGTRCAVDAECFSHHCASVTGQIGGTCVSGLEVSPCSKDADCEGGRKCIEKTGINVCVTPQYMSPCNADSDCPGGLTCQGYRCLSSLGPMPCSHDSDCANLTSRTVTFFGNTYTTPDLSSFGPMFCWTQQENLIASNVYACKPAKVGTVCHLGNPSVECGTGNLCVDEGIWDRSIISPSAGICGHAGPGEGCDEDQQCVGPDNPRGKCDPLPGWITSSHNCTYNGVAGVPCIPDGDQGTCNSGLKCPATVKRCVLPPGCPADSGSH